MSEAPPDRLAVDPDSPYYDEALLARGVGVRFKGVEKTNVDEYCVSEGWVRLSVGSTLESSAAPSNPISRTPPSSLARQELWRGHA
jgi:hypothetical protein